MVTKKDDKFMLAIENPYMNIYFHMDCYRKLNDDLLEILKEYLDDY